MSGSTSEARTSAAARGNELLLDGEACVLEVETAPGKPGSLAAPQARCRREAPKREEAAKLIGRPCLHARPTRDRRVGHIGRVANKATPTNRVAERTVEHGVR